MRIATCLCCSVAMRLLAVFAIVLALVPSGNSAMAEGQPQGIVAPVRLPAFDPAAPTCTPPPELAPSLVFLQDNDRDFMQGVAKGLEAAAASRGLAFSIARADNDPAQMRRQAQESRARKVGAVVIAPIDPRSMARETQELLWSGAYVGAIVPPPATTILNAPQFETGRVLGEAAARYVEERLGGEANVVLLTHDSNQFLARRFEAIRQALSTVPGIRIVADISPNTVDRNGGFEVMQAILLAQPDIDVVLGADTVVLGALDALRAANKDRPDQFLGGIDGEPEAVEEIRRGGPYKASISLASPVFGYALGQFAADWLSGRSVPQAMDILPRVLEASNLDAYEADLADPRAVFDDPVRRGQYLRMYGNICFDSREDYLNFPWSSEAE